jgi:hypothetical protein
VLLLNGHGKKARNVCDFFYQQNIVCYIEKMLFSCRGRGNKSCAYVTDEITRLCSM